MEEQGEPDVARNLLQHSPVYFFTMPSYKSDYAINGFIPSVDVLSELESRRLKENFDDLERKAGKCVLCLYFLIKLSH